MSDFIFCHLRKTWVAALPEEKVRQALIQEMVQQLGYPSGSLVLEKNLKQLPHINVSQHSLLPKRRADLIVFAQNLHPQHAFYPLLLVECKAIPLTDKVLRQIIGYNQFVKSYFIGIVNQGQRFLGVLDPYSKEFRFQDSLPTYKTLLTWAKQNHLLYYPENQLH